MLSFLAHMAINAAGFAALLSIRHDLSRMRARWGKVLAEYRAIGENRP